jgi:hypothetical protein
MATDRFAARFSGLTGLSFSMLKRDEKDAEAPSGISFSDSYQPSKGWPKRPIGKPRERGSILAG